MTVSLFILVESVSHGDYLTVDNDQLELFITGCFRKRLDAYYFAHECISENGLSHINTTHVQKFHTLLCILTKKALMNGNKRVVTSS